ncbi:helix-turn-helix domain containing protein [Arthrobacter sp. FX8]|uniref:TetR/AcrR family transcriptional regulator n=1 Tax=Arthrobacter sp. FX8 TaxID=2997335 RepID=UPI00227A0A09|nr:helix-turn-helix domain-containing protein [Arthrobacter sp. FX8]WAJ33842.1 helix-turn-helix domain containing protein [Arthrobacter sp. FX8]
MERKIKRQYDSRRRREQAAETRRTIIAAANELFIAQGYGQTTIKQVAARAGVSVETVYATFGTKASLLRHVWYVDFRGMKRTWRSMTGRRCSPSWPSRTCRRGSAATPSS